MVCALRRYALYGFLLTPLISLLTAADFFVTWLNKYGYENTFT
jgi:hypothetical protein